MDNRNLKLLAIIPMLGISTLCFGNSPYISKVYDYQPAPGQFINETPEISKTDSKETILNKVLEQIGKDRNPGLISLGSFGGYVVFGFDHPIVNKPGEYDFKIYGNCILSNADKTGGSCEPGIVLVSVDENKNGIADDPWYELAGSEYNKPSTKKNYEVTYYKPSSSHVAVPDKDIPSVVDKEYIKWTDSEGGSGYVTKNSFHNNSYWPEWVDSDKIVFKGTCMENNAVDVSGNGSYYVLMKLGWGYADNLPNNDEEYKGFDISWAVDSEGNKVQLGSIDFVKVHTGILACNGWIGEISTEIAGAEDLHPDAVNGITTVTAESERDNKMFDIFGHEIQNPAKGTIYIQGGKKFVAK